MFISKNTTPLFSTLTLSKKNDFGPSGDTVALGDGVGSSSFWA